MDFQRNKSLTKQRQPRGFHSRQYNEDEPSPDNFNTKVALANNQTRGLKPYVEESRTPSPMQLTSVTAEEDERDDKPRRIVSLVGRDLREMVTKNVRDDDNLGRARSKSGSPASSVGGKEDLRDRLQRARLEKGENDTGQPDGIAKARPRVGGDLGKLKRLGLPIGQKFRERSRPWSPTDAERSDPRMEIKTTSPENFIGIEENESNAREAESSRISPAALSTSIGLLARKGALGGSTKGVARRIRRTFTHASAARQSPVPPRNDAFVDDDDEDFEGSSRVTGDSFEEREAQTDRVAAMMLERRYSDADVRRVTRDVASEKTRSSSSGSSSRQFLFEESEPTDLGKRRVALQMLEDENDNEVFSAETPIVVAENGGEEEEEEMAAVSRVTAKKEEKKRKKEEKRKKKLEGKRKRKLEVDGENDDAEAAPKARVLDLDDIMLPEDLDGLFRDQEKIGEDEEKELIAANARASEDGRRAFIVKTDEAPRVVGPVERVRVQRQVTTKTTTTAEEEEENAELGSRSEKSEMEPDSNIGRPIKGSKKKNNDNASGDGDGPKTAEEAETVVGDEGRRRGGASYTVKQKSAAATSRLVTSEARSDEKVESKEESDSKAKGGSRKRIAPPRRKAPSETPVATEKEAPPPAPEIRRKTSPVIAPERKKIREVRKKTAPVPREARGEVNEEAKSAKRKRIPTPRPETKRKTPLAVENAESGMPESRSSDVEKNDNAKDGGRSRDPADAKNEPEVSNRRREKEGGSARPKLAEEDARNRLRDIRSESTTPRAEEENEVEDDVDVRRGSMGGRVTRSRTRSFSSSTEEEERRGDSRKRGRSSPSRCRRSSSRRRRRSRTPTSEKRRRSNSSDSSPRRKRRHSPARRRTPSPSRPSSSRHRRHPSPRRHHHRRSYSSSSSSSSSSPSRPRPAAKSEAPRSSRDSGGKPVGVAAPFSHRPSASIPPLAGPPLPPPGLLGVVGGTPPGSVATSIQPRISYSSATFATFTPSPVVARPDRRVNHDASFDDSFFNRSLVTPPAGSVASAREDFRRAADAVDHPFKRLMASGGLKRGVSVPVVDSHCHLDFLFDKLGFQGNLESFCRENAKFISPNFGGIVANFCDPKNSNDIAYRKWNAVINLPSNHPVKVWQSWSCHPTKAHFFNNGVENFLKSIVNHPSVVAVGEAGLDYSRLPANADHVIEQQRSALAAQCRIAAEARKPLVIHVRDVNGQKTTVHKDTIDVIRQHVPSDQLIHCHCFTGGIDEYNEWQRSFPNTYFGLTNMVGYNWARDTHALASSITLDRLLLETDAPFMTPKSLPSGFGKVCHPGMALCVASTIEELRKDGVTVADILRQTTDNVARVYKLQPFR